MKGTEFIELLTKQVSVAVDVFDWNANLICNLPPIMTESLTFEYHDYPELYIKIQSVPCSKHTPSPL